VVTLVEVDVDSLLNDDALLSRLQAARTPDETKAILKSVPSLKVNLDPEITIRARIGARLTQSGASVADPLTPIRTGPAYPQPMYAALAQLSAEWMLPGVSKIPTDCATLLETNAPFVEAFLLGLNEELSHELLWREYPLGKG